MEPTSDGSREHDLNKSTFSALIGGLDISANVCRLSPYLKQCIFDKTVYFISWEE